MSSLSAAAAPPGQEEPCSIPDSDEPQPSLAPASPLHGDSPRPAKRPRLTLSPSPAALPPAPAAEEVEGDGGATASQDLAFLHGLDPAELDFLPSSDPAVPSPSHASSSSTPARPLQRRNAIQVASKRATSSTTTPLTRPRRSRVAYEREQDPDDSGVFMDAEELHLSQDIELAGGDEIILALGEGAEEGAFAEGHEVDADEEMWAGFDDVEGMVSELEQLPDSREQEDDDHDGEGGSAAAFDFSLGAAGTQGAQGWDPNMVGAFQFASRKPVKMSEENLRKAKALLEADEAEQGGVQDDSTIIPTNVGHAIVPPMRTPAPGSPHPLPPPVSHAGFALAFSTGSGRPTVLPSTTSLARAAELLGHSTINPAPSSSQTSVPLPLAPIRAPLPRPQPRPPPIPSTTSASAPTGFGGFSTGSGVPMALPSEAALAKARGHILSSPPAQTSGGDAEGQSAGRDVFLGSSPAPSGREGFKLPDAGRLGQEAQQAKDGLESPTAARISSGNAGSSDGRRTPLLPVNELVTAGAASSSARQQQQAQPSSPAALAAASRSSSRASARTIAPSPRSHASTSPAPNPPRPAAAIPTPAATRRAPPLATHSTPGPAFRSPMLNATSRTPGPSSFRPPLLASTSTLLSTSTPVKPAPALRRLNLGMTPRARPLPGSPGNKQKKFETPFKGGKRPEGLTPAGVVRLAGGASGGQLGVGGGAVSSAKGKGKAVERETRDLVKVFDLTPPPDRISLADFGMKPQGQYFESVQSLGVPIDILEMTLERGVSFAFACGRSHVEAQAALVAAGANSGLATLPWVKNHWGMLVWKYASYVRSKPDLLTEWWSFEKVVDGLKYRYEREINQAQRSCIKRIQEQDSSAGLPMVLCVSQLRWDDPPEDDEFTSEQVIIGLELTDGWYRIRTNVDPTLKSACERGKLVVGSKIAISAAKIDSSREGTEVLQALSSSTLVISGNSTSLAPWDAKLGFVREPFIASLASLTSSGGVAPLIDVVIERIFPFGYVDLAQGSNHGTWNEEEERTRQDEWSKGRAKAQAMLADAMEKTSNEWQEIIELLQEAVQRAGPPPTASPDSQSAEEEPDEVLDRLEETSNKASLVRKLTARQAHGCLALAGEKSNQARYAAVAELEKELATSFPLRNVRGFRVLRIKCAQNGKKASQRTAQLTVWDADSLGAEFFQQGQRYLVTHVIPKGTWQRRSEEITLATRRDSRWRKVET